MFDGASDLEVGYVAGIFDGEGCIVIQSPRGNIVKRPHLSVTSTDRDVLDFIMSTVGAGRVYQVKRQLSHHKPAFRWVLSSLCEIEEFCGYVFELLSQRRCDQILTTLATCEDSRMIPCRWCGGVFRTKKSQRYCSPHCVAEALRAKGREYYRRDCEAQIVQSQAQTRKARR